MTSRHDDRWSRGRRPRDRRRGSRDRSRRGRAASSGPGRPPSTRRPRGDQRGAPAQTACSALVPPPGAGVTERDPGVEILPGSVGFPVDGRGDCPGRITDISFAGDRARIDGFGTHWPTSTRPSTGSEGRITTTAVEMIADARVAGWDEELAAMEPEFLDRAMRGDHKSLKMLTQHFKACRACRRFEAGAAR